MKFADIPHPIHIILTVVGILIATTGLWIASNRSKAQAASERPSEIRRLLGQGIALVDECERLPNKGTERPADIALKADKWYGDVAGVLSAELDMVYVQRWQEAVFSSSVGNYASTNCPLLGFRVNELRGIIRWAGK
jgi:hypothetical protein